MKKLFALLTILFVACTVVYAAGKGKMAFDRNTYDFGTIQESKGPVSHTFEFTNEGDANLTIIEATAQCGCTKPEFSEKPVGPGKRGKVKVTYNPLGRPGSFEKTITVRNNGNPSKVRLKIKGTVVPKN